MRRETALASLVLVLALVGCSTAGTPTDVVRAPETASPTPCAPSPIAVPTLPAEIPGYTELDPTTGLHMTGRAQEIDLADYRLVVTGTVEQPLSLAYDDLGCMPKVELRCTLVCPGFFEDDATWAGVPLTHVLELAGTEPDAAGLRLYSVDGYAALATMEMVTQQESFLAYEWEGEPLPILHGFPVRAVFPESSGNFWVKWLVRIEVLSGDYTLGPQGDYSPDEGSDWALR